jgi:hypothetical protein
VAEQTREVAKAAALAEKTWMAARAADLAVDVARMSKKKPKSLFGKWRQRTAKTRKMRKNIRQYNVERVQRGNPLDQSHKRMNRKQLKKLNDWIMKAGI